MTKYLKKAETDRKSRNDRKKKQKNLQKAEFFC
jgi:hypothetical protein